MTRPSSALYGLILETSYFGRPEVIVVACPGLSLPAAACPCTTPIPMGNARASMAAEASTIFLQELSAVPERRAMIRRMRSFKSAPETPETHGLGGSRQNAQTLRMPSA